MGAGALKNSVVRELRVAMRWALSIAVLALLASSAWAQSYKQYKDADWNNQTSGAFAFDDDTTAGSIIVVACTYTPVYGHCTTPPTDTEGNIYNLISAKETADGSAGQKIYYAVGIIGGTHDMVTCHSELVTSVGCLGVEIGGVNALDQGSDSTQATGNSTSPTSPTVATTHASEILLGFGGMNPGSSSTFSAYGSGWTGIVQASQQAEYQITFSTGSYTATCSVSPADDWVMGIFAFYQAPPIALNPQTVASGYASVGTVGLAAPAPSGGATVMLSSSNPAVATVPASVLVPAGLASATFTVNTSSVSSTTLVNISATYNSTTSVAALAVVPVNASPQYSIWNSSTVPTVPDDGGSSAVEVGVKFTADTSGFISGIRFYKSAANTGTHVGNLWTSTGQLLATATFTGETASGWQQVNFASPILLTANTIYVASYHTTTGHTSDDNNYFTNIGVDNSPLHAPASGASGGNGVLTLGAGSAFPNTTNLDSNYWVDVVFLASSSPPPLQSLTLNPTSVTGGASLTGTVTLSAAAPADGATVALSSDNTTLATVPSNVTVPAGSTIQTFSVNTSPVEHLESIQISATYGTNEEKATLTLTRCTVDADDREERNHADTRRCAIFDDDTDHRNRRDRLGKSFGDGDKRDDLPLEEKGDYKRR